MRYTVAWANVLTQNNILKFTVTGLCVAVLVFAFTTLKLALRSPLIIDRACFSRATTASDSRHSPVEMEAFIREAVEKRFNTDSKDFRLFLSDEEVQYRVKEQDELGKKGVVQRVFANQVKVDGSSALVDADRVISVGKVRSALAFPLKVTIGSTSRTDSNPYGLILRRVSPISNVQEETSK